MPSQAASRPALPEGEPSLASHFGKDSLRPEGDVAQRQREDKVARRKP